MALTFAASDRGILPDRIIAALAEQGAIRAGRPFAADQIQPASLDLRLGAVAYRVRASFLPGPGITVAQRIAELKLHEFSLTAGAVLETGCVYIVPLIESLALPSDIAAATNPKSSTGRLDVFTRVIADETRGFDRIAGGHGGWRCRQYRSGWRARGAGSVKRRRRLSRQAAHCGDRSRAPRRLRGRRLLGADPGAIRSGADP